MRWNQCPSLVGAVSLGFILAILGCSSAERRVVPPEVSPEEAGQAAIERFDKNKDQQLDTEELTASPALRQAVKEIDLNQDRKLSADEIARRIQDYQASRIGLMDLFCKVTMNSEPLAGATVSLVPEAFLGPAFKPASGLTDARGEAALKTEGMELPGAPCGFFRIEVSKKNETGVETIPARYNQRTTLGKEIAPTTRSGVFEIHLQS